MGAVVDRRAGLTTGPRRRRPRPGREPRARRWAASVGVVLVALWTASVAGLLPVQVVRIDSGSMASTVEGGDLVLLDRGDPQASRHDVVAVPHPRTGELLVKRVTAVGGDTVALEDGVVVVNGEPVCEPWSDPVRIDGVFFGPVPVPAGEVFLLSDDRRLTVDSRTFGTVAAADLAGVVGPRLWPSPGGLPVAPC